VNIKARRLAGTKKMSNDLETVERRNEQLRRRNERREREVEIRRNLPPNMRENWDIATEFPEVPNGSEYIIRNYGEKYEGRNNDDVEIDEKDVVRAKNGRYFTPMEVSSFKEKNTQHCPTYGLCTECLDVGPVGLLCKRCPNDEYNEYYGATFIDMSDKHGWMRREQRWIDCEFVAKVLNTDIIIEKANRKATWLRTPTKQIIWTKMANRLKAQMDARVITTDQLMAKIKQIDSLWEVTED
jgi:hypothetical protein